MLRDTTIGKRLELNNGVYLVYLLVTVRQARLWLADMGLNRRLKPSHLKNLIYLVKQGAYSPYASLVHFVKVNGVDVLINGQHRMQMIIDTGKPQFCLCLFNCPKDLMPLLDQVQATRSPGDVLVLDNVLKKYEGTGGAFAKRIVFYEPSNPISITRNEARPTHKQLKKAIFQNKELFFSALETAMVYPVGKIQREKLLNPTQIATLYYFFAVHTSENRALSFFAELSRFDKIRNPVIQRLYKKLLSLKERNDTRGRFSATIRAFNQYCFGTKYDSGDAFPAIGKGPVKDEKDNAAYVSALRTAELRKENNRIVANICSSLDKWLDSHAIVNNALNRLVGISSISYAEEHDLARRLDLANKWLREGIEPRRE